jgi:hypothetical protein
LYMELLVFSIFAVLVSERVPIVPDRTRNIKFSNQYCGLGRYCTDQRGLC